jgi:transposase-like protein
MGRVRAKGRYPREFKLEVVRRLESGEKTLSELCRELGLSQQYVCRWKQQFAQKGEAAFPGRGKASSDSSEVAALRKELERLKEENEILKKAAAYFARDVR